MDRKTWEYDSSEAGDFWEDAVIEVVVASDHVLITVEEEQAVDSYNETFRCSVKLPPAKVAELMNVLSTALDGAGTTRVQER